MIRAAYVQQYLEYRTKQTDISSDESDCLSTCHYHQIIRVRVCACADSGPCSAVLFCFRATIAAERESHYGVYLSDDSKHIHPFSSTPFDTADYANLFPVDFC